MVQVVLLVLLFSVCGGFVQDAKTLPFPSAGSVMTDEHYNFLMEYIYQERQSRLKLEAKVDYLTQEVRKTTVELNMKIADQKQCGCAAESNNKTSVLEKQVNVIQQNLDAIVKDNAKMTRDHVLIQNKSTEIENEVLSLRQLKSVSYLMTVLALQNQTKHLEREIQSTNSRQTSMASEANARKQDFLALFRKVQNNEQSFAYKTEEIEKQLNVSKTLFENSVQNVENTLNVQIKRIQTSEIQLQTVNQTVIQNDISCIKQINLLESNFRTTNLSIQSSLKAIKNRVLMTALDSRGGHYPGDEIIKFSDIKVSKGIQDLSSFKNTGIFVCEKTGYYMIAIVAGIVSTKGGIYISRNHEVLVRTNKKGEGYLDTHSGIVLTHLNIGDRIFAKSNGDLDTVKGFDSSISILQVS